MSDYTPYARQLLSPEDAEAERMERLLVKPIPTSLVDVFVRMGAYPFGDGSLPISTWRKR